MRELNCHGKNTIKNKINKHKSWNKKELKEIKNHAIFPSLSPRQTFSPECLHILHGPATIGHPWTQLPQRGQSRMGQIHHYGFNGKSRLLGWGNTTSWSLQPGSGSRFILFLLYGLSPVSLYKFSVLPSPAYPITHIAFPLFAIRKSLLFLTEFW